MEYDGWCNRMYGVTRWYRSEAGHGSDLYLDALVFSHLVMEAFAECLHGVVVVEDIAIGEEEDGVFRARVFSCDEGS